MSELGLCTTSGCPLNVVNGKSTSAPHFAVLYRRSAVNDDQKHPTFCTCHTLSSAGIINGRQLVVTGRAGNKNYSAVLGRYLVYVNEQFEHYWQRNTNLQMASNANWHTQFTNSRNETWFRSNGKI